ncbi:MAG: hypothetical protein JHC95_19530, partial [Solirubrobacteraceae bacterium]|nr:hypothetical protein [Solirubrobacteraceae bacterium]
PEGTNDGAIAAAAEKEDGSASIPKTLVALAVLALLVLIGVLGWTIARWLAFDPRWAQRWRHAGREASYRASGAWTDFTDWVRLGR